MGYRIERLEKIRTQLANSHREDLNLLIEFLEDQLPLTLSHDPLHRLNNGVIKCLKTDVSNIPLDDLENLLDFTDECITMVRSADRASKDILGRSKFYARELMYVKLENYILKLKIG
ncbi:MAG TPA: hypothetical protein VIM65_19835 [Cyclobacteriaceae bacterium]